MRKFRRFCTLFTSFEYSRGMSTGFSFSFSLGLKTEPKKAVLVGLRPFCDLQNQTVSGFQPIEKKPEKEYITQIVNNQVGFESSVAYVDCRRHRETERARYSGKASFVDSKSERANRSRERAGKEASRGGGGG